MKFRLLLLFLMIFSSKISVGNGLNRVSSKAVGLLGTIVVHESGHAVTAKLLGAKILAFKPYPTKVKYLLENGKSEIKWVGGLVKHSVFSGENANIKSGWVSAMGSGASLLSVFLLAPLLPEVGGNWSKNTLDTMLWASSFDWPIYVLGDFFSPDYRGDWSKVSKISKIPLPYYFLLSLVAGVTANNYRYHFHKKAFERHERSPRYSFGISTDF